MHITQAVSFVNIRLQRLCITKMGSQTNKSSFLVRNFTEQNLQVPQNGETGHLSAPAPDSGNLVLWLWRA